MNQNIHQINLSYLIIQKAINIKNNIDNNLVLGSLDTVIDIGYAKDYMLLIYEIIKFKKPNDYIISSGSKIKIKDIVKIVFNYLNLDYKKYVIVYSSIIETSKNLNLFGNNELIKKTKAFKRFNNHENFILKILKFKLNETNNR